MNLLRSYARGLKEYMLEKLKLVHFSFKEKIFIITAMLAVFCICADYSVTRPVSNSLFIEAYSTQAFPYAWIAIIPINFLVIACYNRFLSRWGVARMFVTIALSIVATNVSSALFIKDVPFWPFFLYIWKDVYIMLMLQQIWSIINATLDMKKAKFLYGIIYGGGGLGGICGSLLSGFLAVKIGSENLLFFTAPIYGCLFLVFYILLRHGNPAIHEIKTKENPPFWEGVRLISQSRYLFFILSIVAFMQIASTLLDFQFQQFLEKAYPLKDMRTAFTGKVMGIVNSLTLILQFVGSFILVHFLGLRLSHFLIPLFLCMNAVTFLIFPLFGVITFSFTTVKVLDFSIFGILRELLYVPLSIQEKFRAKAVIDVFAHRSSKSLASLLILSVQFLAAASIIPIITWSLVIVFVSWSALVLLMYRKHLPNSNNFYYNQNYEENTSERKGADPSQ